MLTALEYLGSVGVGITSPQLFRANDDKVYIVKLQNNPMGTKVLVNEYVAGWFGRRMELCFPASGLLEIDPQVLKKSRFLQGKGIQARTHFASQYLQHNHYVTRHDLKRAVNKRAMAGVILFDHMFHNVDRTKNRKNLLVCHEEENYVLYAIDNSHLFVRGRWNERILYKLRDEISVNHWRAYGWLFKKFLQADDFTFYADKIKAIGATELTQLVENIPLEWLTKVEERKALLDYMIRRCDMVDHIVAVLCQSIPDVNRRTYFY